ncbi:MAG: exo-alpha-sialidase [Chitinispirillia bacterium]|nr:exo-alpha-sialidase [Chitinispirillia bacterium]
MRKNLPFLCISLIFTLTLLSSSARTQPQTFVWGNVMMGGGGFVSAIITSKTQKNLIYARTDVGGAYRWNDSANSWVSITDWIGPNDMTLMGVDALALDPQNPSRVYMLAGTSYWNDGKTMILRSDNYGETFDTINVTARFKTNGNGMGRQNGERLAVDPNNSNILFCGTRNDGLWRSADRGDTWAKVASAPTLANDLGICLVLFDGNHVAGGSTSRIYIGLSRDANNLYVSNDAGATWEPIPFPAGLSKNLMPQRAVLTPGGRFLYVAAAAYAGPHGNGPSRGALLRYDTGAKTWSDVSPENLLDDPPHPELSGQTQWDAYLGGVGGVSISPADTNFIVASTINAWKPQIWEGTGAKAWGDKIYASKDGGAMWTSVFGDYADGYAASGDEPAALLHKNGFNWIEGESIHWAGSIEIDPFDPKRVFVTSGNGIYMADDFRAAPGERFRFSFTVCGIEETVPLDLVSIPGGPLITVIMDYDGFVHDDITKPVRGSRHSPRIGNTYGIDYAKLRPSVVVKVGGDDKQATHGDYRFPLHYSQDTGRSWTPFAVHPGPGQNYGGDLAVSSDGRVVVWAPHERGVLLRTADWGATWEQAATGLHRKAFPSADPVDPAVFYAFGNGVHRSSDTGKTFIRVGGRAGMDWTNDMQVTPGVKGHVWVVGYAWDGVNGGYLARSVDGGETFHDVDPASDSKYTQRVQHAEAVGFGRAAEGKSYPAIYIYGTIGGVRGIWQSVDEAASWVRIDDERHAFGALANGNFVRGDMNTFGVVYRSTAGRGVAVRMPSEWYEGATAVRRAPVRRHVSPHIRLRGQVLTLTPPGGDVFTVSVYDMRGRRRFNRAYSSPAVLKSRDMVRSKGSYMVTVRGAAGETVFSGKLTVIRD